MPIRTSIRSTLQFTDKRAWHHRIFSASTPAFRPRTCCRTVFRTVNAVISPELTRELGISASSLGLLTSAYFLAFAAMQIPGGMLLDRYGPRRVEPVLLMLPPAARWPSRPATTLRAGACARADRRRRRGLPDGAAQGDRDWYPPERQASLRGWMMVAGGSARCWRPRRWRRLDACFVARGLRRARGRDVCRRGVAIFVTVPDIAAAGARAGLRDAMARRAQRVSQSRFWWMAPLAATGMGSFMAIQGLWSVPWLMEVDGYSRAVAARHLLVMGIVDPHRVTSVSACSRPGSRGAASARDICLRPASPSASLALALIVTRRCPCTYLPWALYGLGAAVNVLGFTVLSEGFPRELTARANTALNLLMFGGSFARSGASACSSMLRASGWASTPPAGCASRLRSCSAATSPPTPGSCLVGDATRSAPAVAALAT